MHWSRDWSCTDHVAIMHCELGWLEFGISDIQCYIKEEEKERELQKKVTEIIKKIYRYKIDNKYQKAKIKNLE